MTERKKSTFGQMDSAVTAPLPQAAVEAEEAPRKAASASGAIAAPQEASEPAASKKKKKVSFYQLPAEEDRARAAWMHTMGHTGHRTITSFMEAAVSTYTRELEKQYNDSTPFN